MAAWVEADGCNREAGTTRLPDTTDDGMTVTRTTYGQGKEGAEVVLIVIEGGGHTWPGREPRLASLGKSTRDISANDLMWEFFQRHPLP
jgi:polyhydroxybutyrate depolymerase